MPAARRSLRFAALTVIFWVAFAPREPPVEERLSQLPPLLVVALADQALLCPQFVTARVCALAGSLTFATPEKAILSGLAWTHPAWTVKATVTARVASLCGLLKVIVARYVPALRFVADAEAVI